MATMHPLLGLMLHMMSTHQGYTTHYGYAPSHGTDGWSPAADKGLNLGTCKEYYETVTLVLDYLQVEYGCPATQVEDRQRINFILQTVLVFYGHLHYRPGSRRWLINHVQKESRYGLLSELIELEVNSLNAENPFFDFEVVAKAFWQSATKQLKNPRDARYAQTEVSEISFIPPEVVASAPRITHYNFEYFEHLMGEVTEVGMFGEETVRITPEFIDSQFWRADEYCQAIEDVFGHLTGDGWRRHVWDVFHEYVLEQEYGWNTAMDRAVLEARDWEEGDEYDAIAALDDLLSSTSEVKA